MKKIIAFTAIMGLTIAAFAQKADSTRNIKIKIRGNATYGAKQPLIVIDGNKQYFRDINSLNEMDPNSIESVTILKDSSAIARYGADGLAGVVEIKTKGLTVSSALISQNNSSNNDLKGKVSGITIRPRNQTQGNANNSDFLISKNGIILKNGVREPLYIVDGKEITEETSINQDNIKSLEILKDDAARKLYGNKANNGAIIITTKNAKALPEKN